MIFWQRLPFAIFGIVVLLIVFVLPFYLVFGGGMASSNLGGSTLAERNLNRITVITGVVFGVTTVVLTWLLG